MGKCVATGRMIVKDWHGNFSGSVVSVKEMLRYTRALMDNISCLLSLTLRIVRRAMLMSVSGGASRLSESLKGLIELGVET